MLISKEALEEKRRYHREYQRKYRQKNKEKINEIKERYWENKARKQKGEEK